MAISARTPLDGCRDWHSPESPPVWASSFPASEQEDLSRDELTAGAPGLLIAVVALGLLLIASSVVFIAV